ncbi:jasmonoyl--L-amino acid synthetase JAR6 [Solanum lycopersicum]|nr:jasmonic acid-amido synthetase JAR1-like [Solanum lycopersicum]
MKDWSTPVCSPGEVIFAPDFQQSLYCHLLSGLIFRDEFQVVSSTFAHSIVHAFRTFEQVWEELVVDIREGVLSSRVTVPSIRLVMSKLLKPDPELAETIYSKCSSLSNWRNLLLSINIDKNTEKDLQLAVEAASKHLVDEKLEVMDFTSHVNVSADPGHYVISWELSGEATDEILQECCDCLDKTFLDAGYVSSRKVNAIGALELRIVKRGTFHKILDHFVGLGGTVSQFKTPRCVGPTNSSLIQILSSNVVKSYSSTAFF